MPDGRCDQNDTGRCLQERANAAKDFSDLGMILKQNRAIRQSVLWKGLCDRFGYGMYDPVNLYIFLVNVNWVIFRTFFCCFRKKH